MLREQDNIDEEINISTVVEAWQQQRYSLTGWVHIHNPSTQPTLHPSYPPLFSDITGKINVPSISDGNSLYNIKPKSSLPEGWRWTSDWMIDLNGLDGLHNPDPNGWYYGNNFDQLVSSCMNRIPAPVTTFSVVRRRRWIRTRTCVSDTARQQHISSMKWITAICSNMAKISMEIDQDVDDAINYEEQRNLCHVDTLQDIDKDASETLGILDGLDERLQAMIKLLKARAQIEEDYALQLKGFSDDWTFPKGRQTNSDEAPEVSDSARIQNNFGVTFDAKNGDSQESNTTLKETSSKSMNRERRRPSSQLAFLRSDSVDTSQNHEYLQGGLFYVMSNINYTMSDRIWEFSNLLKNTLPADISNILLEVQSIHNDCRYDEGPRLRKFLLSSHETACHDLAAYATSIQRTKSFIEYNKRHMERIYMNLCISDQEHQGYHLSLSRKKFMENVSSIASIPNHISQVLKDHNVSINHLDSWLALQLYRQSISTWEANILAYQAFILQQRKLALKVVSRISSLNQSIIKIFHHEQSRIWMDSCRLLEEICLLSRESNLKSNQGVLIKDNAVNRYDIGGSRMESSDMTAEPIPGIDSNTSMPQVDQDTKQSEDDVTQGEMTLSGIENDDDNDVSFCQPSMANSSRLVFPIESFNFSHYISMIADVQYAINPINKGPSLSTPSKSRRSSDQSWDWLSGLAIITFDAMLHILPAGTNIDQCFIMDSFATIISLDISEAAVEPMILQNMGAMDGDIIRIYSNESLTLASNTSIHLAIQTLSYKEWLTSQNSNARNSRISRMMSLAYSAAQDDNQIGHHHQDLSLSNAAIESLLFKVENVNEANMWMRAISNPFIDFSADYQENNL